VKFDPRSNEGIECGMREQVERGSKTTARRPTWTVRGRDSSDLARDKLEAAAVKVAAERGRDLLCPIPAEFEDDSLFAGKSKGR
jgi:hypothetical protein